MNDAVGTVVLAGAVVIALLALSGVIVLMIRFMSSKEEEK